MAPPQHVTASQHAHTLVFVFTLTFVTWRATDLDLHRAASLYAACAADTQQGPLHLTSAARVRAPRTARTAAALPIRESPPLLSLTMSTPLPAPMPPSNDGGHARAWTGVDQRLANSLSRDDFKRVADVRRAVWEGAAAGLVAGAAIGTLCFYGAIASGRAPTLRRKHLWFAVLGGSALGSYVGASVAGVRAVEGIADVLSPPRARRTG